MAGLTVGRTLPALGITQASLALLSLWQVSWLSPKSPPSQAVAQWLLFGLSIMEMTVAGTAQDFHLIPFYALVETPAHHQIGDKGSAN